eukprot:Skav230357  [mRNA]  locus=scaffold1251:95697:110931:- [translate_table: standard]
MRAPIGQRLTDGRCPPWKRGTVLTAVVTRDTSAMRHLLDDFEMPDLFPDDWQGPLQTSACRHQLSVACRAVVGPRILKLSHVIVGEDTEAIMYFDFLLPRLKEAFPDVRSYEGFQRPGDIIFVPGEWWHGVLNLEAPQRPFRGPDNFDSVWCRARKDREKVAYLWLRNMRKFAPRSCATAATYSSCPGVKLGLPERKRSVVPSDPVALAKQLSELHRRNLTKQEEENQQRKEAVAYVACRCMLLLQDIEVSLSKLEVADEVHSLCSLVLSESLSRLQGLIGQRTALEMKCRQARAAREAGGSQERLEVSRHQQLCERLQGGSMWILYSTSAIFWMHILRLKAREKEALDGTTMILCLLWPEVPQSQAKGRCRLLVANLGDSRAVICRQQGHHLGSFRLSDDHKPGRPDEQRRIEGNGGVVDMQGVWRVFTPGPATFGGRSLLWGLAVSRAFGDLLMKERRSFGRVVNDGSPAAEAGLEVFFDFIVEINGVVMDADQTTFAKAIQDAENQRTKSRDVYVTPRRWGGAGLLGAVAPLPEPEVPHGPQLNEKLAMLRDGIAVLPSTLFFCPSGTSSSHPSKAR